MNFKVRDIMTGKEGTLLPSSGWSWKDIVWDDGTKSENVAGWQLELV